MVRKCYRDFFAYRDLSNRAIVVCHGTHQSCNGDEYNQQQRSTSSNVRLASSENFATWVLLIRRDYQWNRMWNSLLWSITSASLTASGWLWNKRIGKVEQHTSFERVIATKLSFVGRAKISHPSFHDYHDLSLSWRRLALDKRGWGRLNKNRVFRCLWHLFMSREDEDDVRDIGKHDFRSVLLHPVLSANAHRWRTEPFHKFPIELWVYKTSNTE